MKAGIICRLTFHAIVIESFTKFVDDDEKHRFGVLQFLQNKLCIIMCVTPDQRHNTHKLFSLPSLTTFLSGCSRSSDGFSTTSITKINRRLFNQWLPFDITKWKTLGAIYITTATLILSSIKTVFPPPSLLPLSWRAKKIRKKCDKEITYLHNGPIQV